jgi:hypothetical protein
MRERDWDVIQARLPIARGRVLNAIRRRDGGASLYDLCLFLHWPSNRISGRITELSKDGLIVDSGYRKKSLISGRVNIIWVPAETVPDVKVPYTNSRDNRDSEMDSIGIQISRVSPNSSIKMAGWQAKRMWEAYVTSRSALIG